MAEQTLIEFREEIRRDVAHLVETLDPDADLFPCLMIPREDIIDTETGKPTLILMHVDEFFGSQRGKDVFVNVALPVLIRKFEAKRVALVAATWMAKLDVLDDDERRAMLRKLNREGVAALPEEYRKEGVMVRICDGETEIAAMAEMTRHEGAAPTIEWNAEMETIFNAPPPDAKSEGRMHQGFLIESFAVAKTLPPAAIEMIERTLGMGYWMPNPDDTPEFFKPKP